MLPGEKISLTKEILPIFGVFLLLYTYTISAVLAITHDSILISQTLVESKYYFHPHHLLYFHTVLVWSKLISFLNLDITTAYASINAIFGSLTQVVIYSILRKRIGLSKTLSVLATLIPAFSYGVWFYSSCIEVYIIPLFFLLLAFYNITSNNRNKYIYVGIFHGLAVLYHQTHIFLFVPILFYLLLVDRKQISDFKNQFVRYLIAVTLVVGIPYLSVVFFVKEFYTFSEIWNYLTFYAHDLDKTYWWHDWGFKTIPMMIVGFSRAIMTSHYLFASDFGNSLISKIFPDKSFADETFLVRNLPEMFSYVLLFLAIAIVVFVIYLLFKNIKNYKSIYSDKKGTFVFALSQIICYSIFFSFWDTANQEFWIPQSVFFWLLFTIVITQSPKTKNNSKFFLSVIAASLFIVNFAGSINFSKDFENDYYASTLMPISKKAKSNDMIIIEDNYYAKEYLIFMTDAEIILLQEHFYEYREDSIFVDYHRELIDNKLKSDGNIYIIKHTPKPTFTREQNLLIHKLWGNYDSKFIVEKDGESGFIRLSK